MHVDTSMRHRKAVKRPGRSLVIEYLSVAIHMKFRSFRHNYHDGQLASFTLGPRQELTLEIALDPVWNKTRLSVSVRFWGIENFDEVAAFFLALPPPSCPDAFIAEVIGLLYLGQGPNWVVIDLASHGHIRIQSHHVNESL